MSDDDGDLALQTLLSAGREVAPHLDEELLRQCYAIQKKYQFSDDRSMSASAMERLIDATVARRAGVV
jgi:Small protein found in certain Dnd DNA modification systems